MIATQEAALVQARQQFEQLARLVQQRRDQRLDLLEADLFRGVLEIGRQLLAAYVAGHGTGDVGPTLAVEEGTVHRQPATVDKRYVSVFGELHFPRAVYCQRAKRRQHAPLDARLGLPDGPFSYLLQNWLQHRCLDEDFRGSSNGLAEMLPVHPSVRSVEHMNRQMAAPAEDFQAQQPLPKPPAAGQFLVASADGKGVPMVPCDRPTPAETADEGKRGCKRMADAGTVYQIDPFVRSAADVLDEVRRRDAATTRPQPEGKVVWAELARDVDGAPVSGRTVVLANIAAELDRRDPSQIQPVILLFDGERALWETATAMLERPFVAILDLWHVLTYLWKAAKVFHRDECDGERFVTARLRLLLTGRVEGVIRGLRRLRRQHRLTGARAKTLATVIGYLCQNRVAMHYDQYLAAGYPIGSGVIEGACRHVIKDRMERTGMHWRHPSAQAMLHLRAIEINGHWAAYQEFRIGREQQRLYGATAPHALAA